jgi:hypothetical protein
MKNDSLEDVFLAGLLRYSESWGRLIMNKITPDQDGVSD